MVQLLVHHHAAIDQPCDVGNVLHVYNSTSLSLFSVLLFAESPAYSVLFTLSCSPQDVYAATSLIAASGKNHIEVARFLVEHGASTDYQKKVLYDLFGYLSFLYSSTEWKVSPSSCMCLWQFRYCEITNSIQRKH